MPKKANTFVSRILNFIKEEAEYLPMPLETPYAWIKRANKVPYKRYYDTINNLKKRKIIEVSKKKGKKFVRLTQKGQLEILIAKSIGRKEVGRWDGKWRLIMFDIPEAARKKRDQLRILLKKNGFLKFQNSIFISPHKLNREAIEYLKITGLINYIRIIRADEIDSDMDLIARFHLKKSR